MIINKFRRLPPLALLLAATLAAITLACSGATQPPSSDGGNGATTSGQSAASQEGKALFNQTCALCHGAAGTGTQAGPPLVHPIYEPGHHPDISFRNAVKNGVISHHWQFGHMPPQPGVSDADVEKIICYIRELQIAGGIYEGDAC